MVRPIWLAMPAVRVASAWNYPPQAHAREGRYERTPHTSSLSPAQAQVKVFLWTIGARIRRRGAAEGVVPGTTARAAPAQRAGSTGLSNLVPPGLNRAAWPLLPAPATEWRAAGRCGTQASAPGAAPRPCA